MIIDIRRDILRAKQTFGLLYVNGSFECYTLEDTVREVEGQPVEQWKIPKLTAIPRGSYRVTIEMSHHFKKMLPRLHDVPGYEGVLIHSGNTADDTEGCIIVGAARFVTYVTMSRIAMGRLQPKIQTAIDAGENVQLIVR